MSEKKVFIAEGARLVGDVQLGEDCGVWYNAVIRADKSTATIGNRSNIQDNCTVHAEVNFPVTIGNDVTVGHGAIIHGCTIEDCCLIGMGSIIMNGAVIGEGSMVGAGAMVTGGKIIPPGSLVLGNPAKVVRPVTAEEREQILESAKEYMHFAALAGGKK
ncbi:MAG: gamma carbonic anhydrase family protein [Oscillospiraceae bacterium]|nr:gamma carbonic anhydrase family protein [Oscillospiraceae bacterium]